MLVGFNSVNRHLEALSAVSCRYLGLHPTELDGKDITKPQHIAAVFLLRPIDNIIYSHLPILCSTASLAHQKAPATRLLLLDSAVEKRLTEALGQPSASIVALTEPEDASDVPGLRAVLDYVRENVNAVEAGWLKEAINAKWLGTKIDVQ